jgi:hypothetical protein
MPLRRDNDTFSTAEEVLSDRIEKLTKRVNRIAARTTTTIQAIIKQDFADPVQGEVQWHYPWQRGYIWHNKQWRPLMPPTYHVLLSADAKPPSADKPVTFPVSRDMDGFYLMDIEVALVTAGTASVMIHNTTTAQDMLLAACSTGGGNNSDLTIEETTALINPATSQVSWKDMIKIQPVAVGGLGLRVILVFNPENETHA